MQGAVPTPVFKPWNGVNNLLHNVFTIATSKDAVAKAAITAVAIGQMGMGSLFMGTAAFMVSNGSITGGGPRDFKQRQQLMATGWQPYSLVTEKEDGSKTYVPFGRLDPVAIPFGIIADLQDAIHNLGDGGGRNGQFAPRLISSLTAAEATQRTADTAEGIYVTSTQNALYVWVRSFVGPLVAPWFGALDDGTTDCTTAIQAAVNVMKDRDTLHFPSRISGSYKFTDTINIPLEKNMRFTGPGQRTVELRMFTTAKPLFKYARTTGKQPSVVTFDGLMLILNGLTKTVGSYGIQFMGFDDNAANTYLRVYNCFFFGFERAIYSKWTGQSRVVDCFFQANTVSMYLERGCSFWHFRDIMSFDDTLIWADARWTVDNLSRWVNR